MKNTEVPKIEVNDLKKDPKLGWTFQSEGDFEEGEMFLIYDKKEQYYPEVDECLPMVHRFIYTEKHGFLNVLDPNDQIDVEPDSNEAIYLGSVATPDSVIIKE